MLLLQLVVSVLSGSVVKVMALRVKSFFVRLMREGGLKQDLEVRMTVKVLVAFSPFTLVMCPLFALRCCCGDVGPCIGKRTVLRFIGMAVVISLSVVRRW